MQPRFIRELVNQVYSIERIEALATQAEIRLTSLGYANVEVKHSDGSRGWSEMSPFDAISVAAASDQIPQNLLNQLAVGGRLVMPLGRTQSTQQLICVSRTTDSFVQEEHGRVRFVPLVSDEATV